MLVVLGVAAIVVPVVATLAFTLVIGWLFLISGGVGLVTTFWMRNAPGFWWALLSAVIALAAGIVLILWPISGTLSLTLVLIAFFVVEGIATLMYAFEHQRAALRPLGLDAGERASSISFSPASSSPDCPAPRPGRSGSWSASTCCSAAPR